MRSRVRGGAGLVGAVVFLTATTLGAQGPPSGSRGAPPSGSRGAPPSGSHGEQLFVVQGCYGCHQIGKFGTPIGPDLSHVGAKYEARYLEQWLQDPESVRPTAHMPKLELTAQEIESLAAYLATLR